MDLNPFFADIAPALAGDAGISDLCQAEYGREVKVYMNYDARHPPGADDCPAVCVYPAEKSYGGDTYHDAIECVCLVHDDRAEEAYMGHDNVVGYAGVRHAESLRKAALRVISDRVAQTVSGQIDEIAVDYDTITQFPYIYAAMAVAISESWTMGSGNPAENQ